MNRFPVYAAFLLALIAYCGFSASVLADKFAIELDPQFDQIGEQIEVAMGYYLEGEDFSTVPRYTFGIYDTGASVVTWDATIQYLFNTINLGAPIKAPGGASAEGFNGSVDGDVSYPGYIVSDGMHAISVESVYGFTSAKANWNLDTSSSQPLSAVAPGVQMFVGDIQSTSANLPTIAGTPIHYSVNHNNSAAAHINMRGQVFDLSEWFPDILTTSVPYHVPDLHYVDSNTHLQPSTDPTKISNPIRIPITLLGEDNHEAPDLQPTVVSNPFVSGVRVAMDEDPDTQLQSTGKNFLFDTGAMVSLISTDIAIKLGLSLDPEESPYSIDVAGAAGDAITLAGHDVPFLELPYGNLDGTDQGTLQFQNATVFIYDVGEGIDGILGMNLFNLAEEMLYNPYGYGGASLELTFNLGDRFFNPELENYETSQNYSLFSSMFLDSSYWNIMPTVPEPSAFILMGMAAAMLFARRLWRRG